MQRFLQQKRCVRMSIRGAEVMKNAFFPYLLFLLASTTLGWVTLDGTVGYPPTEKYVVLESRNSIFLIPTDSLSEQEKLKFLEIGRHISIAQRTGVIRYVWAVGMDGPKSSHPRSHPDSDRTETRGDVTFLRGTVVPAATGDDAFVRSGNTLYQIARSSLPMEERKNLDEPGMRVSLKVPARGLISSWPIAKLEAPSRAPAERSPRESWDLIKPSGEKLIIQGTARQSMDDKYFLIQSKGIIFQIQRSSTDSPEDRLLQTPGARVRLVLPSGALTYAWRS